MVVVVVVVVVVGGGGGGGGALTHQTQASGRVEESTKRREFTLPWKVPVNMHLQVKLDRSKLPVSRLSFSLMVIVGVVGLRVAEAVHRERRERGGCQREGERRSCCSGSSSNRRRKRG